MAKDLKVLLPLVVRTFVTTRTGRGSTFVVSRLLPIVVIAALVPVVPAAAAEWSCKVHHEVYPTPCTTQHHRCPDFTDKNGDGICDNMVILGAASKSSGSSSSSSAPTSAGKYKTGVPTGLIGLAAILAAVGAYLTFRG
jgi:hypothetical protein